MVSRGKNAPKHSSLDNFFSTNRPFGGYSLQLLSRHDGWVRLAGCRSGTFVWTVLCGNE